MADWDTFEDCFKRAISNDLMEMMCGNRISRGQYRLVYDYVPDPSCVIKVEAAGTDFCNAQEWRVWQSVKDTEYAKWFAPCIGISPNSIFLIQKKTKPYKKKPPEKLPNFFADIKVGNFGMYKGHLAFHDYANNFIIEKGLSKRMRKAEWEWKND